MSAPLDFVVAAVVLRSSAGDVILVRKRGTQRFMLPGGKIDPGETPAAAAIREIHEELGVVLNADELEELGVFEASAANEPGKRVQGHMFTHPALPGAQPQREIEEMIWFTPGEQRSDLAPLFEHHVLPLLK